MQREREACARFVIVVVDEQECVRTAQRPQGRNQSVLFLVEMANPDGFLINTYLLLFDGRILYFSTQ